VVYGSLPFDLGGFVGADVLELLVDEFDALLLVLVDVVAVDVHALDFAVEVHAVGHVLGELLGDVLAVALDLVVAEAQSCFAVALVLFAHLWLLELLACRLRALLHTKNIALLSYASNLPLA
jgi:hypothetical protein